MVINLTDQELNEWVVNKFGVPYYNYNGLPINYCQDLNHTRLMEERIREMGEYSNFYQILMAVVGAVSKNEIDYSKTGYASARQRVEAAYLTFGEGNDTRGTY